MTVRGRLDPGLEKPEEEREEGGVIRHHETKGRSQTQLEALRTIYRKGVRYHGRIDRLALQSQSFGGQGRPGLRTIDRRPGWFLKCPIW